MAKASASGADVAGCVGFGFASMPGPGRSSVVAVSITEGPVEVEPAAAIAAFCASYIVASFTASVRATLTTAIEGPLLGVGVAP